jgi:farnesyl-diphosphate farnesyltransferase
MREKELLRRTSRSFYLTIRLLPRCLRADLTLAYLLARATDTIADTSTAPAEQRMDLLRAAQRSLNQRKIEGYDPQTWIRFQRDPSEAALLERLPDLWSAMQGCDTSVRTLIADLMDRILEGQIFDLTRFHEGASPLTTHELERYTYLVAGCVGEFWHELCRLKLGNYDTSSSEVMNSRARHYGQALQLVNIIRDRNMDHALGRIYLPSDDVPHAMRQAREWLGEGADYCAAVRSGRLRYATLLPTLLGFRTLNLCEAQPSGMLTPVKVPRAEVRRWMRRALPVWWSSASVIALARRAAA